MPGEHNFVCIPVAAGHLPADVAVPPNPAGIILFAHGSGSGRTSPRNREVASAFRSAGFGTVLLDLLTAAEAEHDAQFADLRFDLSLLTDRLLTAVRWVRAQSALAALPLGLFGASTGAAAALRAAGILGHTIDAVVSRGGRPDLAGDALPLVVCPTLLIVGGRDQDVLALNREAGLRLGGVAQLEVVRGASHLFDEPGAMTQVATLATAWFKRHLATARTAVPLIPVRGRP